MTEFGRYLKQCPAALKDKTRTLSLLKDALNNDLPKFRVLQAAFELGMLEALQRNNPISVDDRLKITTGLISQYAMLENVAKNAIDYWQNSVDVDILYRAFNGADECRESIINSIESIAQPTPSIKAKQDHFENRLKIKSVSQDSIRLGIRLQWEKQPEIECYEIWRGKEKESPVKIKEGSFPIPRYQDYDVENNCCYTYAIRGLNEFGKDIAYSADIQLIAPSKPLVFQIRELQFNFSGIQIKWNMIFEAKKYIVQKYSYNVGWITLAELPVEQTVYLDVTTQSEVSVQYKIQCICKNGIVLETAKIEMNI